MEGRIGVQDTGRTSALCQVPAGSGTQGYITQGLCPPKAKTKNSRDAHGKLTITRLCPALGPVSSHPPSSPITHPLLLKRKLTPEPPRFPCAEEEAGSDRAQGLPQGQMVSYGPSLRLMPLLREPVTGHSHRRPQSQPIWPNKFGNDSRCLQKLAMITMYQKLS